MNKLVLAVASLGTFGLVACTCNPVTQTDCRGGEKYTFVIDSAPMEPLLGTTRCVLDGNIDEGVACTRSVDGTPDNCKSSLWCSGGVCEEICNSGSFDSCSTDQGQCVHAAGIFEDDAIGFCRPAPCDVLRQDCP